MAPHLYYFSTQTELAHTIQEQYYKSFYVYMAEEFDPLHQGSSNPKELYKLFHKIKTSPDYGEPKYKSTTQVLRRVAQKNYSNGLITQFQRDKIFSMLNRDRGIHYFTPLIYIIRADLVGTQIKEVPEKKRANPLAREYYIEDLRPDQFAIIKGILE